MIVRINPTEAISSCSLQSFYSWNHRDVQEALIRLFAVTPGEVIVAIDVSDKGITAYFERGVMANENTTRGG